MRLLVLQHGYQKASELSGVPYALVRQWESRRKRKEQRVTNVTNPVTVAADNIQNELAEAEHETRLSLARSAKHMAKRAEKAKLNESGDVHNVAKTASIVHKWDSKTNQNNVVVNVALLGIDPSEVRVSE